MEISLKKIKFCCVASVDMTLRFMLFSQLKFLQSQGYEVHAVCSPGKWVKEIEKEGIKVKTIKLSRKMVSPIDDLAAFVRLFFYFKKEKFDIVHVHTPKAEIYGQIAAYLAGVPIIVNTLHGFGFDLPKEASYWPKKIYMFLEKLAGKCSSTVFSISYDIIEKAKKHRIFSPDKIFYLGRDIDTERFDPKKYPEEFILAKKRELGIASNKKIVGIVARMVAEKGYLELFEAFKKVVLKFPNAVILVIGQHETDKEDAIKPDLAKQYKIENNAMFLGERTDAQELYPVMDVFVLPSHREGLGASILEASAMEKPVIACNIGGCPEAVDDGKTGILVPVKDSKSLAESIIFLLQNPDKAIQMGKEGRKKVLAEFHQEIVFSRMKNKYSALIEENSQLQFENLWQKRYSKVAFEKGEDYEMLFSIGRSGENYQRYFFNYFGNHIKKNNQEKTLLDVGCGLGAYCDIFSKMGFRAYGIDYIKEVVELARQNIKNDSVNLRVENIYNLSFSDNFFDFVICKEVLQVIYDSERALKELKRVLRKDGMLAIITLNSLSLGKFFIKEKLVKYNPYKVKRKLEKLGFKDVKIKGIYLLPFSSTNFFVETIILLNIQNIVNLLFPIFCIFSHSFYIEARKES